MVDDNEQYDGEEGEYHFSDDQINYELDADSSKTEKAPVAPSSGSNIKDIIFTKAVQHRKPIIGVLVFVILTGIIYKIVMPSSTAPTTDIMAASPVVSSSQTEHTTTSTTNPSSPGGAAQQSASLNAAGSNLPMNNQPTNSNVQTANSQIDNVNQQTMAGGVLPSGAMAPTNSQPINPPTSSSNMSSTPSGMVSPNASVNPGTSSGMISPNMNAQASGMITSNPSTNTGPSSGMVAPNGSVNGQPTSSGMVPPNASANMGSPSGVASSNNTGTQTIPGMVSPSGVVSTVPPSGQNMPLQQAQSIVQSTDAQSKNVVDRLASLEQQNAAMMNLLQTEYAQKMSDYETQNTASRGKMEELTKRINRMEATLSQLAQIIQGGRQAATVNAFPSNVVMMNGQEPAPRAQEPKMTYSVQAIIPGRAWLKSESGDTITVAEGDILRNYGRVTKIDPYDGVVNIDTGNKVITLSYGMSAD